MSAALEKLSPRFVEGLQTSEVAGHGIEAQIGADTYRFGSPAWAAPNDTAPGASAVVLAKNGRALTDVSLVERFREDAQREVQELQRSGMDLWILSGDEQDAVDDAAKRLGVPRDRALNSLSPESKAEWLRRHAGHRTLFVGDGINDALIAQDAHCAGTPSIDRPFMPARCDFYFTTAGLRPIGLALRVAHRVRKVVRSNLIAALIYNAAVIALAWAGLMTPWLAAVLMPLSSLAFVSATAWQLSPRSPVWKS